MFCWRGVIPNVIPDSILTPSLRVRIRRPRHAEETSAHDQPDPRPTPQGHRNHQRDRHLGIRPPRLGRAALHHLWDPRLPLPRRPPQATRPLPQLDPQGRRQDRHPAPQRRTACPIRTLVPGPPAPTGTPGRTRSPLPGDHRERTTPGNRPETKNTGHLEDLEADAVDGPDVLVLLDHVLADDRAHFSSLELVPSTLGPSSWAIRGFAANNFPMASNVMKASPWAGSPRTSSLSPALRLKSRRAAAGMTTCPRSLTVTAP